MMFVYFLQIMFFFFNQKTAYEMRISDWSSDVCSSDLHGAARPDARWFRTAYRHQSSRPVCIDRPVVRRAVRGAASPRGDRKSVVWGKSVSVRLDLGGRRFMKKKKQPHMLIKHYLYHFISSFYNLNVSILSPSLY